MLIPPPQFERLFRAAGWDGCARCKPNENVPTEHPGYEILRFFDGIHVRHHRIDELGQSLGELDVEFGWRSELSSAAEKWRTKLRVEWVGIAATRNSYGHLWVDDDGRFFESNDITEHFVFVAKTWQTAIGNILTGAATQELLDSGRAWFPGDDRYYDWKSRVPLD